MKYRKKPIVIEAVQFLGDYDNEEQEIHSKSSLINIEEKEPLWLINAIKDKTIYFDFEAKGTVVKIRTLEGIMTASKGDYIIRGVNGELYPCKPDIFEKTYEKVKE